MKKKNLIASLVITLTLAGGATAFAAAPDSPSTSNPIGTCLYYGKTTAMRGYTAVTNVLKSKFGVTDDEINKAAQSGKTLYDVAKDKGVTDEQFKSAVIEERIKAIDQAVKDGTMTKEQADFMKERINTNSKNMTPGQCGMGMKGGRGMGRFSAPAAPSVNSSAQ
jgi:bacterioferritin-associated ferredoxin